MLIRLLIESWYFPYKKAFLSTSSNNFIILVHNDKLIVTSISDLLIFIISFSINQFEESRISKQNTYIPLIVTDWKGPDVLTQVVIMNKNHLWWTYMVDSNTFLQLHQKSIVRKSLQLNDCFMHRLTNHLFILDRFQDIYLVITSTCYFSYICIIRTEDKRMAIMDIDSWRRSR